MKRLSGEDVERIINQRDRKLYLVEYTESYLRELLDKYDLGDKICGIISDASDRATGDLSKGACVVCIDSKKISVIPYRDVSSISGRAYFLILNDYFREIYDRFMEAACERENGEWEVFFYANKETAFDLSYRQIYADTPLQNLIVFRSGPHASAYVKGMDYADNARALFEYMLSVGLNQKYELVWLVKDPKEYIDIEKSYENVHFISFSYSVSDVVWERDEYYRVLCLAKYIFMTDAYGFARNSREDQIRIQLWHGCGFKTRVNFVRCEKRYEYNIVISNIYQEIHKQIYGLRMDQVLVTGYPKDDWLFSPMKDWKEVFQIPSAMKYIFWLPTFRKAGNDGLALLDEHSFQNEVGLPILSSFEELTELNQILKEDDNVLIIKLHPFQDRSMINIERMSNIHILENEDLVEKRVAINQLLGYADALISDYSSAAVDFLILDRPIAFTLDDVEEYENSRGFVFHPLKEWLPGKELYSFSDFCIFIHEIGKGIDTEKEKRNRIRLKLHSFFDDKSCQRVTEALGIVL